jgi:PAS domain S-box-containing protein
MTDASGLRILVVEDDPDTRANLCDILDLDGYDPVPAGTAAEALDRADWNSYAAILLDWRLPDARGETLLPQLRHRAPDAAVIVSTGVGGLEGAVVALRHGAADYITKPVDAELLRASIRRVAEQRRLKLEKARSEAAFRGLVEAAGSMILIFRPDGRIAYVNPFGEQLIGYTCEEVLNRDCIELLVEGDRHRTARERMQRVMSNGPERGFEVPVTSRDGQRHWLLWNAQRLEDFGGEPAILAIGQDVTDRKIAEAKLLQAERLAAIGKAITGLAHESRNALQRGQANLELLTLIIQDSPDALDLVKRLQKVQSDLHRLYEEVRLYAAPLNLTPEPRDLGDLIREAWEQLAPQHVSRDASIEIDADGTDLRCPVDHFQMLQAFRNILENSLAAAPDPARITASFAPGRLEHADVVHIRLRDNGPGIPADRAQSVFDEFFTTKTRGTGLGLAIVKRIIDAHGGTVRVNSDCTTGAELIVTLPRA